MPLVNAANWSDVAIISPVGDADVSQTDWLAQRGVESHPAAVRHEDFRPCVRSLAADDVLLLRIRGGSAAGNQISGNVASRNSAHPHDAKQQVREILADACANGKRILD